MVGTWDHEEFYEEFNEWCDKIEERQEEDFRLTESEYINVEGDKE